MEIRIGVQNVTRELVLDIDESVDEIKGRIQEALTNGTVLELKDTKGREIMIPSAVIGYFEIGDATPRPVGFVAH